MVVGGLAARRLAEFSGCRRDSLINGRVIKYGFLSVKSCHEFVRAFGGVLPKCLSRLTIAVEALFLGRYRSARLEASLGKRLLCNRLASIQPRAQSFTLTGQNSSPASCSPCYATQLPN